MDSRRKKIIKSSARSSIADLIARAQKEKDPSKSKRYVKMALDLMTKNRIRLPKQLKNSFCKKCCSVWIPGKTATVSYDRKHHCLRIKCRCGYSKRI